jgi:RHS repeat-associated protein
MISAIHKDVSGNVIATVTEKYDVFGNRVEEDVASGSTTSVSKFAFDPSGNVWADLNGSNVLVTRRLYLDGVNQPFARITIGGGVAWYLTDHLGSIRAITDNNGAGIDEVNYDAFGNVTSETQPSNGDRLKAFGYAFQVTTGLYFVSRRVYDPGTGRWMEMDRESFAAGQPNLYQYVGNNPTNQVDPSGAKSLSPAEILEKKTALKTGKISSILSSGAQLTKSQHAILIKTTENLASLKGNYSVVALRPKTREEENNWSETAKEVWPSVKVYTVSSLPNLNTKLTDERYPNGSIRLLIISCHTSDQVGFFTSVVIAAHAEATRSIANKLTDDAIIDIQVCGSFGTVGNRQAMANAFQATIITTEYVCWYDEEVGHSWNNAAFWRVTRPNTNNEEIHKARRR